MQQLRKKLQTQKKEKAMLENQINGYYGGEEKGLYKEEQMTLITNEIKQLNKQLEEIQKETAEIDKYKK